MYRSYPTLRSILAALEENVEHLHIVGVASSGQLIAAPPHGGPCNPHPRQTPGPLLTSLQRMPALILELHITAEHFLDYYRGTARTVHATAVNGQTVIFPASALQRHVTREGIHGWFALEFDDHPRFIRLDRCNPPAKGLERLA